MEKYIESKNELVETYNLVHLGGNLEQKMMAYYEK